MTAMEMTPMSSTLFLGIGSEEEFREVGDPFWRAKGDRMELIVP